MSDRTKQATMSRLIDLVNYIQGNEKVTAETLANRFSISESAVYQDLRELNAVGIPVFFSSTGLCIPPVHSALPQYSIDESMLIYMGLTMLYSKGMVDHDQLQTLRSRLFPSAEETDKINIFDSAKHSQAPVTNPVDAGIMSILNNAVLDKQRVRMTYRSRSNANPGVRELSPYTLVFRKESWYVIGYCHRRRELRTFKTSRIEKIEYSKDAFQVDEEFDADEYMMYRWYIMGGDPELVIVRFSGDVAPLILEKKVSHGSVWREDDYVYMQTLVSNLEEFSWWVMQYGELAEVLQPRQLRKILAKRCSKMANMYSKAIFERSRRVKR